MDADLLPLRPVARAVLGLTGLVAAVALLLQLGLVLAGDTALGLEAPPPLPVALGRLVSYFTIQSNVLVAVSCLWLALARRGRPGRVLRWLRVASLMGIVITGLVHWFLLRPLLDLQGLRSLTDTLLHVVVPLLAVLGWLLVGPRRQASVALAGAALVWPVLWTVSTLVVGGLTGWYPYPFLDVGRNGATAVAVACLGIAAGFVAVLVVVVLVDRLLPAPVGGLSSAARSDGRPTGRPRA